jgi:hypothetical protein
MTRTVIILAALVAGTGAAAETIRCQSQGYCTMDRERFDDSSTMRVDVAPDGSARWAWVSDDMFWFEAPGRGDGPMRVWVNDSIEGGTQTLVIMDSGEGTFQIASDLGDMFYASMQVLSCSGKG